MNKNLQSKFWCTHNQFTNFRKAVNFVRISKCVMGRFSQSQHKEFVKGCSDFYDLGGSLLWKFYVVHVSWVSDPSQPKTFYFQVINKHGTLYGFHFFLPLAGRYVLMVSLYDCLGGHVLKWSNLKGQQWGGATLPLQHDGEFFNIEIKVGLTKHTVYISWWTHE